VINHSLARALGFLVLTAACAAQTSPIPDDTEIKTTASGLKYSVLKGGGEGASPAPQDTVLVHYTGWLTDGTEFDSSRRRGEPISFGVTQVIAGWTEGLQLMKAGERFKFTIPSDLAYGPQGRPSIPPNSILIFDVELIEVISLPKFRAGDPTAQKTTASGIKWEVVVPGEGARPADDDIVDLKFAIWTPTGQLQECTEQGGGTLKFPLDGQAPLEFLTEAATLLRVGDRIRLEVPAAMMGEGSPPSVWELELMGTARPVPVPAFSALDPEKTTRTASGLEYEVIEPGTGASPSATDTVTVHYAGWLTDGTAFDSSFSRGETTSFPLNGVIRGWTEGVQLMKAGAIYKFQIPGNLAYGPRGSPPTIGPNATLIFYIQLISVD
jgi:FKBP-type peptidyl-prolyl cis-trans isomerase